MNTRPNIVIIMADELRADMVRHAFIPDLVLPNLDFANHGYDAIAIGKTHNMCPGFRSITYDHKRAFAANHGYNVTDADCVGVFEGPEEAYGDFIACRQFDGYLEACVSYGRYARAVSSGAGSGRTRESVWSSGSGRH